MGLDYVELVLDLETHFEIEIANSEANSIHTVGDLRDLICSKLVSNGWRASPEVIFREVSDIISKRQGISIEKISETSQIFEDLKID
jgi:acyl carrier protein